MIVLAYVADRIKIPPEKHKVQLAGSL